MVKGLIRRFINQFVELDGVDLLDWGYDFLSSDIHTHDKPPPKR
jgi:hypothetical protein